MNLGESKEEELDASELMNLLDFDDDMFGSKRTRAAQTSAIQYRAKIVEPHAS